MEPILAQYFGYLDVLAAVRFGVQDFLDELDFLCLDDRRRRNDEVRRHLQLDVETRISI